jgi:hypothetical protein
MPWTNDFTSPRQLVELLAVDVAQRAGTCGGPTSTYILHLGDHQLERALVSVGSGLDGDERPVAGATVM